MKAARQTIRALPEEDRMDAAIFATDLLQHRLVLWVDDPVIPDRLLAPEWIEESVRASREKRNVAADTE